MEMREKEALGWQQGWSGGDALRNDLGEDGRTWLKFKGVGESRRPLNDSVGA